MIVVEEGISNKSFAISMVATVLAFASMIFFLNIFNETTPLLPQLAGSALTIALFVVGGAAWAGKFDKKKPPLHIPERFEVPEEEPVPKTKVKPAPKEAWTDKWLRENT